MTAQNFKLFRKQHRVLRNLRKNKYIVTTKSDKGRLNEDPTLKHEPSLQRFLHKLKQKTFLTKMYMINCILLILLLLVSMVLLKCTSFPLVTHFLILPVSFVISFSPEVPDDYSFKETFSFVSQIKNANLSGKFLVSYDVTNLFTNIPLQENIDIAINLIFNHNPNLNITKK